MNQRTNRLNAIHNKMDVGVSCSKKPTTVALGSLTRCVSCRRDRPLHGEWKEIKTEKKSRSEERQKEKKDRKKEKRRKNQNIFLPDDVEGDFKVESSGKTNSNNTKRRQK